VAGVVEELHTLIYTELQKNIDKLAEAIAMVCKGYIIIYGNALPTVLNKHKADMAVCGLYIECVISFTYTLTTIAKSIRSTIYKFMMSGIDGLNY